MKLLIKVILLPIYFISFFLMIIGNWHYQRENYSDANNFYIAANIWNLDPTFYAPINQAKALYKQSKYEDALVIYNSMINTFSNDDQQILANLYYDKGNTLYRIGESKLGKDNPQVITLWESAIVEYENDLKINKNDNEAQENIDFIKKKLQELKDKMAKENNSQDNKNDNKTNSKTVQQKEKENKENYEDGKGYHDYKDDSYKDYDEEYW